ncbi:MAG TPA: microviridin/marinostatin family tricyclic proteinase inhibitor [Pyrinomonadaceae bacterium]|nr:microviridin/marinostatin family tricyclic proteinase inhibitor [Pyrinomonadaceae bacterium]
MRDDQDSGVRQGTSKQDGSLPFFARFLEGQDNTGQTSATLKFPSDLDELDQTMKYPSDSDEGEPWHS